MIHLQFEIMCYQVILTWWLEVELVAIGGIELEYEQERSLILL